MIEPGARVQLKFPVPAWIVQSVGDVIGEVVEIPGVHSWENVVVHTTDGRDVWIHPRWLEVI